MMTNSILDTLRNWLESDETGGEAVVLMPATEHLGATLGGLEPGTRYVITVTAQNLVGRGPAATLTVETKA